MSDLPSPVVVKNASQKTVLNFTADASLTGNPAALWIGMAKADEPKPVGVGHPGLVFLRNAAGEDGIVLDGSNGIILNGSNGITLNGSHGFSVRDHAGKDLLNFTANANLTDNPAALWIGMAKADEPKPVGAGHPGLVFLRNTAGEDGIVLDGSNGIILNGSNGFSVRDHAGHDVLNFTAEVNMPGKPAGLWIGMAKADIRWATGNRPGLLVIRDKSGNDSIVIDGAQGSIVLSNEDSPKQITLDGSTGNITTSGDIFLSHADCAEDFDVLDSAEEGTVMVIGESGGLRRCDQPYDRRVAGVISGAGECKPAIVLDKQDSMVHRMPVALVGKVHCRVDAQYSPVEIGDLLTTSATAGHAMKASDPLKAFGAVIGKALRPIAEGCGLIPILVALQ